MNYTDSLAMLWVEDGKSNSAFCTAVPISSRRLLTAGHVFDDFAKLAKSQLKSVRSGNTKKSKSSKGLQIFVRFSPYSKGSDIPAFLIWWGKEDSEEKFDVAVLDCSVPKNITPLREFVRENPVEEWEWEATGFSQIGFETNYTGTMLDPIIGEGTTWQTTAKGFRLFAKNPPREPEDWGGASGCPVVIKKGFPKIVGIQSACDSPKDKPEIVMVPLCRLLENNTFCNAIELDVGEYYKLETWTKEKLKEILGYLDEQSKRDIAEIVSCPFSHKINDKALERLAETLIEPLSKGSLIAQLVNLYKKMETKNNDDAKEIGEVIDTVLALHFPADAVCSLIKQTSDCDCLMVVETASTHHGAEVLMSAKDKRPTRFKSLKKGSKLDFRGQPALPFEKPPLGNPGETKLKIIEDIAENVDPNILAFQSDDAETRFASISDLLSQALGEWPELDMGTPYCVVSFTKTDSEIKREAIESIRKAVKPLIFLELANKDVRPDLAAAEVKLIQWLKPQIKRFEQYGTT